MKKIFLFFILFLVMVGVVIAAQPSIFTGDSGLEIEAIAPQTIPISTTINVTFYVFNKSNGVIYSNGDVDCNGRLASPYGNILTNQEAGEYQDYFYFTLENNIATTPGIYGYSFRCNTSDLGGYYNNAFEVTNDGEQVAVDGSASFPIMLLVLLLTISILIINNKINLNNEWATYIIKKCLYICFVWMLVLNITIAINVAAIFGLSSINHLLVLLMTICLWIAHISTMLLIVFGIINGLKLYKQCKKNKRMGGNYGE